MTTNVKLTDHAASILVQLSLPVPHVKKGFLTTIVDKSCNCCMVTLRGSKMQRSYAVYICFVDVDRGPFYERPNDRSVSKAGSYGQRRSLISIISVRRKLRYKQKGFLSNPFKQRSGRKFSESCSKNDNCGILTASRTFSSIGYFTISQSRPNICDTASAHPETAARWKALFDCLSATQQLAPATTNFPATPTKKVSVGTLYTQK